MIARKNSISTLLKCRRPTNQRQSQKTGYHCNRQKDISRLRLRMEHLWQELCVPHSDRDCFLARHCCTRRCSKSITSHIHELLQYRKAVQNVLLAIAHRERLSRNSGVNPRKSSEERLALQQANEIILRAIFNWRRYLNLPLPFRWRGHSNYILRLKDSRDSESTNSIVTAEEFIQMKVRSHCLQLRHHQDRFIPLLRTSEDDHRIDDIWLQEFGYSASSMLLLSTVEESPTTTYLSTTIDERTFPRFHSRDVQLKVAATRVIQKYIRIYYWPRYLHRKARQEKAVAVHRIQFFWRRYRASRIVWRLLIEKKNNLSHYRDLWRQRN